MSFASEPPTAPGVLQHPAPRPAVFMPPHPSDEELAFNWTLSERVVSLNLRDKQSRDPGTIVLSHAVYPGMSLGSDSPANQPSSRLDQSCPQPWLA
jgi:hypothetical protein